MKTKLKTVVRLFAKPFIWYINQSAKNYEELFRGNHNIPYFF